MSPTPIWNGPVADGPDFARNLGALLRREQPARTVLFEFYHNGPLYRSVTAERAGETAYARDIRAFAALGYDYANLFPPNGFGFPAAEHRTQQSMSMNEAAVIRSRADFEAYPWPKVEDFDWSYLDIALTALAPGQLLMAAGPCGVLENVIRLVGFERMCEWLTDDPGLLKEVFDRVGACLLAYYQRVAPHPAVGFLMSNDDWGFKTQTMLSPKQMRKLVFPWHERIVACAHAVGKPAVLHSCGKLEPVMDDVIDGMRFDGKHSYEDGIMPVEEAHARWGRRIAILGGIDVDYVCRTPAVQVHARVKSLIERSCNTWAVGTGNSVPEWVPRDTFLALIEAGLAGRRRIVAD